MGCDFVGAYGLTETTGGGTILRAEDHDSGGPKAYLLRSAGRPWADIDLRIVDPETLEDLGEGEVGEIWLRSVVTLKLLERPISDRRGLSGRSMMKGRAGSVQGMLGTFPTAFCSSMTVSRT